MKTRQRRRLVVLLVVAAALIVTGTVAVRAARFLLLIARSKYTVEAFGVIGSSYDTGRPIQDRARLDGWGRPIYHGCFRGNLVLLSVGQNGVFDSKNGQSDDLIKMDGVNLPQDMLSSIEQGSPEFWSICMAAVTNGTTAKARIERCPGPREPLDWEVPDRRLPAK